MALLTATVLTLATELLLKGGFAVFIARLLKKFA